MKRIALPALPNFKEVSKARNKYPHTLHISIHETRITS